MPLKWDKKKIVGTKRLCVRFNYINIPSFRMHITQFLLKNFDINVQFILSFKAHTDEKVYTQRIMTQVNM